MFRKINLLFMCLAFTAGSVLKAQENFMGEIKMFAGNFAPKGWAFCDGQTLSIVQNPALFSLLGTTYGGDGVKTFRLPDLRGRVAINEGQNNQQGYYTLGQAGGYEAITLTQANLPQHVHNVPATQTDLKTSGASLSTGNKSVLTTGNAANTNIASSVAGASAPVYNVQPYLVVHYIICTAGTFPLRND